jgi:hypothetical protein
MEQREIARVQKLQERINSALRTRPEDVAGSNFSPYMPNSASQLTRRLTQAAGAGGIEGVEAVMDEFERLVEHEDLARAQYALMSFLTNHPVATRLRLRVPSLVERSPWKVLPSKRNF